MRFNSEKKRSIVMYILEKINEKTPSLSARVAEAFDVSTNTIHSYLNELTEDNVIRKVKRGEYELVSEEYSHTFKRSKGEISNDTYAYDVCMRALIKDYPENVKHIWSYAFSEMVNNVMDHSEAECLRVVINKNFLDTRVMIIDNGVGIFEKIKNHFSLTDLDEAVCELFKGKLTTDADHHSGEGIFFTSRMMDSFFILSDGKVFTTNKYNDDLFASIEGTVAKGTGVIMSLSNHTQKKAHEIFNMFEDLDGDFSKTRIPLKNIFDSAPVSRSQAKRICNRLDNFKEAILDFADLEWMGQGFAHQLFVVYKKVNPDIVLKPINMNESVTDMYNHVVGTAK